MVSVQGEKSLSRKTKFGLGHVECQIAMSYLEINGSRWRGRVSESREVFLRTGGKVAF